MEGIKDFSYGVVPLYRDGEELRVLLVHQISYRGAEDKFWILPKGHKEGDESDVEAARRELFEEAGVSSVEIAPEPKFTISYKFVHDDVQIDKTVTYFVGWCASVETNVSQPEEIQAVCWLTFDEAKNLLTHQNSKDVLEQVETYLNSKI